MKALINTNYAFLRTAFLYVLVAPIAEAHPTLPPQQVIDQLLIDNSSDSELVIRNHDVVLEPTNTQPKRMPSSTKTYVLPSGELPYFNEVAVAAQFTQIDAALIHAVIATESGYNPHALSKKGAYGLMQVLPDTAKSLSKQPVSQWSVQQQILLGARYLRSLIDMFEGDVVLAIAAYNAGPNAVRTYHGTIPPYAETKQYVPKVLANYRAFQFRLKDASSKR